MLKVRSLAVLTIALATAGLAGSLVSPFLLDAARANEVAPYEFFQKPKPSPTELEFPFVPDPSMTTGSLCRPGNSDFTEYRYPEKIAYCARSVSSKLKDAIYKAYGVPKNCRSEYTIDHFIPLSLGGTNMRDNLWPEPKEVKHLRQNLEMDLYEDLRDGKITQAEAIEQIREAKLNPPVSDPTSYSICH